jgi:hypothetical protein
LFILESQEIQKWAGNEIQEEDFKDYKVIWEEKGWIRGYWEKGFVYRR